MNQEPRQRTDYSPRQTEAARRVLIDIGQVLAPFHDCLVVVGGWVPDLLLPAVSVDAHVGSIDVDLALDVRRLGDGRYAELLGLLLATRGIGKAPRASNSSPTLISEMGSAPWRSRSSFLRRKTSS